MTCLVGIPCQMFPEHFRYEWSWSICSLNINPCKYFLWGYLRDRVYCTIPHTVQELQVQFEAVAKETTGDMLGNKVHNFVVHLQWVHEIRGVSY